MPSNSELDRLFWESLPDKEALMGDPGLAPAANVAGMVMNPKNAKKLASLLIKASPQSKMELLLAWAKNKYPKISSLPKEWKAIDEAGKAQKIAELRRKSKVLAGDLYDPQGEYDSVKGVAKIFTPEARDLPDLANTAMHEAVHAGQFTRGRVNDWLREATEGGITNPTRMANAVREVMESYAGQGGDTAQVAYLRMINQLPPGMKQKFAEMLRSLKP